MTFAFNIGIDFGGTQLRKGEVDTQTGDITGLDTLLSASFTSDDALTAEVVRMLAQYPPGSTLVGVSAAGKINEQGLVIEFAPNCGIREPLHFPAALAQLGYTVVLTNDMKAAASGVARYGQGRDLARVATATHSSGYNVAVTENGIVVTTAEFGHQRYAHQDGMWCGCGNRGCLEPYVSANGAASMAKQYFSMVHATDHPIIRLVSKELTDQLGSTPTFNEAVSAITARHVYEALASDPTGAPQSGIRDTQMRAIAHTFGLYVSGYNPLDLIVLMGGLTHQWEPLFVPAIDLYRSEPGHMPQLDTLRVERITLDEPGVVGGVAYARNAQGL